MLQAVRREKKCRACPTQFVPSRPLQVACCPACAQAIAQRNREKAEKRAATIERQKARAALEALKTAPQLMAEADRAFCAYIRARDKAAGHPLHLVWPAAFRLGWQQRRCGPLPQPWRGIASPLRRAQLSRTNEAREPCNRAATWSSTAPISSSASASRRSRRLSRTTARTNGPATAARDPRHVPAKAARTDEGEARLSKRERILLRVERGALVPADAHSQQRLQEKGYRVGDILAAELIKPRHPGFWRLAHRIGTLCVETSMRSRVSRLIRQSRSCNSMPG